MFQYHNDDSPGSQTYKENGENNAIVISFASLLVAFEKKHEDGTSSSPCCDCCSGKMDKRETIRFVFLHTKPDLESFDFFKLAVKIQADF